LSQVPEGYAKVCYALADVDGILYEDVAVSTIVFTGSDDQICPSSTCDQYIAKIKNFENVVNLPNVGHWHVFKDCVGLSAALHTTISSKT
jgi:hypothetical protein